MRFSRSNPPFFEDPETMSALEVISKSDRVVFFCGAGVTIDRTGHSWSHLITSLFPEQRLNEQPDRPTQAEVYEILGLLPPLSLASVYTQYEEELWGAGKAANKKLVPVLQQRLYSAQSWQAGPLVPALIRLAFNLANLGKSVTFLTTDYETHLEEAYEAYRKLIVEETGGDDRIFSPGLVPRVLGDGTNLPRIPSEGDLSEIELVYLHGRVPEHGEAQGLLVLNENQYEAARPAVVEELSRCLGQEGAAVVLLGASLTDPPLIAALSATRGKSSKVALLPAEAPQAIQPVMESYLRYKELMGKRGKHLGMTVLFPDFHLQVAQFVQEISSAAVIGAVGGEYGDDSHPAKYGNRLTEWWSGWQETGWFSAPESMQQYLAEKLADIIKTVKPNAKKRSSFGAESFRLEIWLRCNPDDRRLVRMGSSDAVLKDYDIAKCEDIELGSMNASVRAFVEGRPQYFDAVGDIGGTARRWLSFLCVPIVVPTVHGALPVGVVTLCATRGQGKSIVSTATGESKRDVVTQMQAAGLDLLEVTEKVSPRGS